MSLSERFRARLADSKPPSAEAVDDDLVELANRSFMDRAKDFDPQASFETSLDVILSGSDVRAGTITFDVASAIFHQVQAEVREAVPPGEDRTYAELELVNIGEGSVVIHARGAVVAEHDPDQLNIPIPVLDSALLRVFDLHDALEQGDSKINAVDRRLLDRVRQLTAALDSHNLNLAMNWHAASGSRRASTITERGRGIARSLFERRERETEVGLSGNIYGFTLDGTVSLRLRRSGRVVTLEITGFDRSLLTELRLDQYIRVLVRRRARSDGAGLQESQSYEFVRLVSDPELDLPDLDS